MSSDGSDRALKAFCAKRTKFLFLQLNTQRKAFQLSEVVTVTESIVALYMPLKLLVPADVLPLLE